MPKRFLACDFMVAVTARFRVLYILLLIEIGSRRIVHFNGTEHPTADWTLQQFREAIPGDHCYRFLIHDRHATFSTEFDKAVEHFGITPIRAPVRAPQTNAFCERLIGTVRRECMDYVIPIDERHLRRILREANPSYPSTTGQPTCTHWSGINASDDRHPPDT